MLVVVVALFYLFVYLLFFWAVKWFFQHVDFDSFLFSLPALLKNLMFGKDVWDEVKNRLFMF